MRVENNTVILEPKDCEHCDDERTPPGYVISQFGWKQCHKCKGTGKRGSGRCRECNNLNGYFSQRSPRRPGWLPDYNVITETEICGTCNGNPTNAMQENLCDHMPVEILRSIPIVVKRSTRPQTFNEAHLGFGTVYSVTDYGRHKTETDEELIAKVRKDFDGFAQSQATKVTDRATMKLCERIVIFTSDNGWAAYPDWSPND